MPAPSATVEDAALALVLFDLDGTLADTAPDLVGAANDCRVAHGREPLPMAQLRPWSSHGARGLIGQAFGSAPGDPDYEALRTEFIARYEARRHEGTTLFPGVDAMLRRLEAAGVRWGIVTNKVARLTGPLIEVLQLGERASCVVCGDTAARPKPDPAPVLHALAHCGQRAAAAAYVGDDRRDIQAGRAAGVRTVAVAYGYSAGMDDIHAWQADHVIAEPGDLLDWTALRPALARR